MLNFLRWTLANITATIAGIIVGLPIAHYGFYFVVRWFDFFDCSGIPCDDRAFPTMILMGIVGGLLGGIVGYLAFQKLTRSEIVAKYLIRYAILGAFLWPIVGVFWVAFYLVVIYFDFDFFTSSLDFVLSSNRALREVYADFWLFVVLVIIPGIVLGTILSVLWRIPNYNRKHFLQRKS